MSDDSTPRLALPMLVPGQAQKELFHNEALALIDLALHAAVISVGATVPPTSPAVGDCWILGTTPGDAWTGRGLHLAGWTAGGWRFVVPREGMTAWSIADGTDALFAGGSWTIGDQRCRRLVIGGRQVVGAQQPAVTAPSGGASIDTEARAVLAALIGAMEAHGLIAR